MLRATLQRLYEEMQEMTFETVSLESDDDDDDSSGVHVSWAVMTTPMTMTMTMSVTIMTTIMKTTFFEMM